MLKPKMTRKYVTENSRPYKIGYCALQNLLTYREPSGYTCGINGWGADIYEFCDFSTNITIVTGYSPFGKSVDYETVNRYENIARKVIDYYYCRNYDEARAAMNKVIKAFLCDISGRLENNDEYAAAVESDLLDLLAEINAG